MSLAAIVITVLIIVLIFMMLFYAFKNIEDTKWWRDMEAESAYERKLEIEMRLAQKYGDVTTESEKNDFMNRINNGEKVSMPYPAYAYIFNHIDDFGFIDENNQIVLVNREAFRRVMEKVNPKTVVIDEEVPKLDKNSNYLQTKITEEGTTTQRNMNDNSFVIETSDGRVIKTSGRSVIVTETKTEESNSKGQERDKKVLNATYEQNVENDMPDDNLEIDDNAGVTSSNIAKIPLKNEPKKSKNTKVKSRAEMANEFDAQLLKDLEAQMHDDKEIESEKNEVENVVNFDNKKVKKSNEIFTTEFRFNYDEFDSFISQNRDGLIFEILMVILKMKNQFEYPVVLINSNSLFIDISYFALCFANSISGEKERINFVENFFNGTKISSIDNVNSLKIIEEINEMNLMIVKEDLIHNWNNKSEEKVFLTKRFFKSQNNIYSSLMLSMKVKNLDKINVGTFEVNECEFVDNQKSTFDISKDIFDTFLKI